VASTPVPLGPAGDAPRLLQVKVIEAACTSGDKQAVGRPVLPRNGVGVGVKAGAVELYATKPGSKLRVNWKAPRFDTLSIIRSTDVSTPESTTCDIGAMRSVTGPGVWVGDGARVRVAVLDGVGVAVRVGVSVAVEQPAVGQGVGV
jgi:hypothetical protein